MKIQVECYSGFRGEETPRYILIENGKIEVKKILDRWLAPDHRYFKILGADDAIYIVRHDPQRWCWELTFYQAAAKPATDDTQHNG
jgi:hypothetical protein